MVLVWGKYSSDTDSSYTRTVEYIVSHYHSPNYISKSYQINSKLQIRLPVNYEIVYFSFYQSSYLLE